MRIKEEFQDGQLHIWLIGELDHHGARSAMADIESKINRLLPRICTVDFRELSFMDSSGIAVILKTHRRMKEIGGKMSVVNVPNQPMKVLDASGLDRVIDIMPLGQEEYI